MSKTPELGPLLPVLVIPASSNNLETAQRVTQTFRRPVVGLHPVMPDMGRNLAGWRPSGDVLDTSPAYKELDTYKQACFGRIAEVAGLLVVNAQSEVTPYFQWENYLTSWALDIMQATLQMRKKVVLWREPKFRNRAHELGLGKTISGIVAPRLTRWDDMKSVVKIAGQNDQRVSAIFRKGNKG